ncbi:MAG TPA: enoyl-CoA hydratase-related protein [Rhizomicrobium sp.]|nr:enoyl-CoA hydratase-related protein [Rhizomicrobium sp.]
MTDQPARPERRTILKSAAAMAGIVTAAADAQPLPATRLADVTLAPENKVTLERRGDIVLIGINRPYIQNRIDPETTHGLAKAFTDYDRDDSLRCAILFGHGDNFSRGIDVDAHKAGLAGAPAPDNTGLIDTLGKSSASRLSKPLIAVVHGDTWNLGHEIFLAADIRVCSADVRFGQDETSHARFPGGGGTIRFVREVGWGNAMRYVLTGDHWGAQEAFRMGEVQEIAPNKDAALQAGIRLAAKVAACGPLGIKTALLSAHTAIDVSEPEAFSKLGKQYNDLYATRDFQEGRDAEAQNRQPVYTGR